MLGSTLLLMHSYCQFVSLISGSFCVRFSTVWWYIKSVSDLCVHVRVQLPVVIETGL